MNEKLKPVIEKMLVKVVCGYSLETAFCLAFEINHLGSARGGEMAFCDGLLQGTSIRLFGCGWIELDNRPLVTNESRIKLLQDILTVFNQPAETM